MMTLSSVENNLQTHLGDHYIMTDWEAVLKAVMESEDDKTALDAVSSHHALASSCTGLKILIPAWPTSSNSNMIPKPTQLVSVESEMLESIQYLRDWNHIHGLLPSVDEFIEPPEERDLPEPVLDGCVEVITAEVHQEMAIVNGDVIEIDGHNDVVDDDDAGSDMVPSCQELIELCRRIEAGCTHYHMEVIPNFLLVCPSN